MIAINLWGFIVALGLPSAITAVLFRRLEKRQDKREEARKKKDILLVNSIGAAVALGEATAIAIKNGKTNGETEKALAYAREVKHKQRDYFVEQGIESLY